MRFLWLRTLIVLLSVVECYGWKEKRKRTHKQKPSSQATHIPTLCPTTVPVPSTAKPTRTSKAPLSVATAVASNESTLQVVSVKVYPRPTTQAPATLPSEVVLAPVTNTQAPAFAQSVTTDENPAVAAQNLSLTTFRVSITLSDISVKATASRPLETSQVGPAVSRFLKNFLKTHYHPRVAFVETETALAQRGANGQVEFTMGSTVWFDPGRIVLQSEVDESVANYISSGGDNVLELALQDVGVAKIESFTQNGEVIRRSVASPTPAPNTERTRKRGILRQPGAIAFLIIAGVFVCFLTAPLAATFSGNRANRR